MVEVKSLSGDYLEAGYQAGVASILVMMNLIENDPKMKAETSFPIPSLVILGHDWKIHWLFHDGAQGSVSFHPTNRAKGISIPS